MAAASRPDPSGLRTLPALAPFLVRPGLVPARPAPVATGLAALDRLLGGGFPRGRVSELIGPRASGRTSVLLAALGCASAGGALTALVDATDGLDPASARAAGVVLPRLLWVRCGGSLRAAMQAADVVVRGGGFGVVAVDLGELPAAALTRVPAAALVRLQRAVEATPTALILASPCRLAGSLAAAAVLLAPARACWASGGPGLLTGLATEARLLRARWGGAGGTAPLAWAME